jgi:uncharacterized membrane protein
VVVAAQPGIASLRIAKISASALSDFHVPPPISAASLVKTSVLSVTGQSLVSLQNTTPARLTFDSLDIRNGVTKTVSTQDYLSSALSSLVGNLNMTVTVSGLGVGLGTPAAVKTLVQTTITTVTPALDSVLYTTLSALGVKLGQADIRVTDANCGRSVLVQ